MRRNYLGYILGLLLISGCATTPPVQMVQAGEGLPLTNEILDAAQQAVVLATESYDAGDWAGAELATVRAARILYSIASPRNDANRRYINLTSQVGLMTLRLNQVLHKVSPELEPEEFTMPVPYNSRIERQIDNYLKYGRKGFSRWLRRSGKYVPQLRAMFVDAELPADLVYLALVESGFNPRNRSHKQAVGLFQFIQSTATMVGLKKDYWIDERRDPEKAGQAAIKHLKSLYKEFGDWDLALAAYNAGSGRVKRAMKAQGVTDYWQLSLPPETEAYVPRFYATLIIAQEPHLYGFNPELEDEEIYDEVEVPGSVDFKIVAEAIGVSVSVVADLNTELTKGCTPPGPETFQLRLPKGSQERFSQGFSEIPEERKYLTKEEIARRKFKGVYFVYKIKSGDSLYTIAKKHHTTIAKIKKWNSSVRTSKYIHPGKKLRIYRTR